MSSLANEAQQIYLLSSVRKRRFPKRGGAGKLRIPAYILCFIIEGEGVIVLDGALQKVRPFQLYLLVPGMIVDIPEQASTFEYYGIWFDPIRLTKKQGSYEARTASPLAGTLSPGMLTVHQPQSILQAMVRLYQLGKKESIRHSFQGRMLLEQLVYDLAQQGPVPSGKAMDERIERSILYMKQNYPDKISIEQLAEAAGGMSAAAFSRLFRQETGIPPIEYLSNVRMTEAKVLLSAKDSRVKEVAAEVGFRSEFYFSRMFQRTVGVSPTQYMKRGMLKVAVASSLSLEDHLKALGIEPVCVVDLFRYPGQSEEQHTDHMKNQLALLQQSRPDLIIADDYHAEFRDEFKKSASPVFLDFEVWDWKRNFEQIAELVHREREASEMLTRLYVQSETTGQKLRGMLGDERLMLMQVNHRAIGIQGRAGHPLNELIYGELALNHGAPASEELWRLEMQPEEIAVLEAEHVFIHQHHVLAGSSERYQQLIRTPAWSGMEAVRRGCVHEIPNWFAMSWTPLGRQRIMMELLDMLNGRWQSGNRN